MAVRRNDTAIWIAVWVAACFGAAAAATTERLLLTIDDDTAALQVATVGPSPKTGKLSDRVELPARSAVGSVLYSATASGNLAFTASYKRISMPEESAYPFFENYLTVSSLAGAAPKVLSTSKLGGLSSASRGRCQFVENSFGVAPTDGSLAAVKRDDGIYSVAGTVECLKPAPGTEFGQCSSLRYIVTYSFNSKTGIFNGVPLYRNPGPTSECFSKPLATITTLKYVNGVLHGIRTTNDAENNIESVRLVKLSGGKTIDTGVGVSNDVGNPSKGQYLGGAVNSADSFYARYYFGKLGGDTPHMGITRFQKGKSPAVLTGKSLVTDGDSFIMAPVTSATRIYALRQSFDENFAPPAILALSKTANGSSKLYEPLSDLFGFFVDLNVVRK